MSLIAGFISQLGCIGRWRHLLVGAVVASVPQISWGEVTPTDFHAYADLEAVFSASTGEVVEDAKDEMGEWQAGVRDLALSLDSLEMWKISGASEARQFPVRDEGDFLRYVASTVIDFERQALANSVSGTVTTTATAGLSFQFEVMDEAMPVQLLFEATLEADFLMTLRSLSGGGEIYSESSPHGSGFTGTLVPGIYKLELNLGESTTRSEVGEHVFVELAVGNESEEAPLPVEGRYSHPDMHTSHSGEGLLDLKGIQVLSETSRGDGSTALVISAEVENRGNTSWPEIRLEVVEAPSPEVETEVSFGVFALDAGETGSPEVGNEAVVIVADEDLETFRSQLLDGTRLQVSGEESAVFRFPVRPLVEADLPKHALAEPEDFTSSGDVLSFAPLFGSGTAVVEWEPFFKAPLQVSIEKQLLEDDIIQWVQNVDRILPVLVKDVRLEPTGFRVEFFTEVLPYRFSLLDLMIDGRMVCPNVPEAHPAGIAVTEVPETRQGAHEGALGKFPSPVPFHFNDIRLGEGIRVSGSFGFRPQSIDLTLDMRDAVVHELSVRTRYQADCNLLLETEEGASNESEPWVSKTATLLDLPLFSITLPAGFRFEPRLTLEAGAEISAPTSLSVPLTAGLDIDLTAGYRDGEAFYENEFEPIPLHVSDPGLYEALGAEASAWIDCEIAGLMGAGGGGVMTGPTLGIRAQGDFRVAPLDDPWWSAEAHLTAFAGIELNLAGWVDLVDAEHDLASWPLFDVGSGGPLVSNAGAKSLNSQPGFRPLGNPKTRWMRSLLPDSNGVPLSRCFAQPLHGTDDWLVGGGSPVESILARLSPEGELKWAVNAGGTFLPYDAVADADGGFTAVTSSSGAFRLVHFDGTGEVIWKKEVGVPSGILWFRTVGIATREGAEGAEYFVAGQVYGPPDLTLQTAVVKLNASGEPLWSRTYALETDTAGAMGMTKDGDVLVAASSTMDLGATNFLTNITSNGWVMKIDGDSGDYLWGNLQGFRYGVGYASISEGPDGCVYVGGNSMRGVGSESPSLVLTKLTPDGEWVDSVLVGCNEASGELFHRGETPYDTVRGMTWIDGNLWICGNVGLYNSGGISGAEADGESGFTAMVSENLDVSRFVIHAGPSTDRFHEIEVTTDGLLVVGSSRSFHPWPSGAGGEDSVTPTALMVAMLPWEGRTRFHLASAGSSGDDAGTVFVFPRIRAVSQYTMATNQGHFAGLGLLNITESTSSRPVITPGAYAATHQDFSMWPNAIEPFEFKSLEFLPRSLITDRASFMEWYQMDGSFNGDGDAFPAGTEFFLGTDPGKPDFEVIGFERFLDDITGDPWVRYRLPRSLMSGDEVPGVGSSHLLEAWEDRDDVSVFTEPRDSKTETLRLELPAPEPKAFYRLSLPE
ncbi:hypothetical protein HNR46_003062 [Haloferula luteola]|uniref:Uncharacterized protein n=1 Tax=Haloferula luteola TaxID=595692 RepID=A0A840VB88_9BACT|nr:PQQ-like beta-propeller repeat protein [Haloferula luteola]MBB5352814.1 hypothetical protein [Haloferula luteola]